MSTPNAKARRQRKFENQGGLCHWCRKPMTLEYTTKRNGQPGISDNFATFEHLQRRRDGGGGKPHNVVLACRRCNNGRDAHMQLAPRKQENVIAARRTNKELLDRLAAGTMSDAERGELFSRGLVPNWPMWSKLMATLPLGNP